MEVFPLSWIDVLWDQGKHRVHIPKTRHHSGKEFRYVPIGDILPCLEAAFEEAEPGTDRMVTRFNRSNSNLDKPFRKILAAAGLVPWPKLFQNLRASCETDWLDSGMPAHVVANWMGHSVKVQNDSYAQVDDHHFERFNAMVAKGGHFLATTTCEDMQTREQQAAENSSKPSVFPSRSQTVASVRTYRLAEAGLEPARPLRTRDFKSRASANSATRPQILVSYHMTLNNQPDQNVG